MRKRIFLYLFFFFGFLFIAKAQYLDNRHKEDIKTVIDKMQKQKKEYTKLIHVLPIRNNKVYSGSSIWQDKTFTDILQSNYEKYFENSSVFAIKRNRVIEIFPK